MSRYALNLPPKLKQEAEQHAQRQDISLNQFILWAVAEKVGELRHDVDDPRFPQITYRRGASGRPTPVLRGTGIRVQTMVISTRQGDSVSEIAENHDLPEGQIREALAFYDVHRAEIDANIQDEADLEAARA